MDKIAKGDKVEDALKVEKISDDKIVEEISKIVKEKPGLRANAYMGIVVQKLGAGIDKRKAMEIINRMIGAK